MGLVVQQCEAAINLCFDGFLCILGIQSKIGSCCFFSNNIAVICKYYYIKVLLKEIGLFDNKQKSAYISISDNSQAIITQHVKNMEEVKLNIEERKSNNYQFYSGSLKCIR